jgi:antitoxin component YwqK of YwqJK toxin-antitoxin module
VVQVDETGNKATSEFWFRGRLVGRAFWDSDGSLCMAVGLRDGVAVGLQIEYRDGAVVYAEPFAKGVIHGLAKQYRRDGRLLLVSPFTQGTGTDFWCDERGRLAEEHPLVQGKPSGTERWWNPDQTTVFSETEWLNGVWHGASRHWTDGRLDRGFPKFYVRGKRIAERAYLRLARQDPGLPPYRPEADSPARTLPKMFLKLRERAGRAGGR